MENYSKSTDRKGASAVFSFKNPSIYTLGGYSNRHFLNSTEKLDIFRCVKWESMNVLNIFSPRSCMHAIQINSDSAVVFGHHNGSREYFVISINDNIECKQIGNMPMGAAFYYCAAPVRNGNKVYGSDSNKRIHIYSIDANKWDLIE